MRDGDDNAHNAPLTSQMRRVASRVNLAARGLATGTAPKTAIVMLNMGGPSSLDGETDGVRPFLTNLFTDPEIIPLGPLQKYLVRAPLIPVCTTLSQPVWSDAPCARRARTSPNGGRRASPSSTRPSGASPQSATGRRCKDRKW